MLIFLTTLPRPPPKAAPRSAERCELGQHSSWRSVFLLHERFECCTDTSVSNRISEQISCRSRPVAPATARSSPGTPRSEGQSEEEDVFVGAIRPCRARESKSQVSSPSGPNTVATTTARSSNRSGHDSTNANEGSPPSSSEPASIISTAASPRILKSVSFARRAVNLPGAGFPKMARRRDFRGWAGSRCLGELASTPS